MNEIYAFAFGPVSPQLTRAACRCRSASVASLEVSSKKERGQNTPLVMRINAPLGNVILGTIYIHCRQTAVAWPGVGLLLDHLETFVCKWLWSPSSWLGGMAVLPGPLLETGCPAGFASHPSHPHLSLQIAILGHVSKKLHLMFPVNAAKEDGCQWDGYFTALPSSPDPLVSSEFYINTKEISKRAGVFQQYNTTRGYGSA